MLRSSEVEAALSAGLAWVDARVARELMKIRRASVESTKRLLQATQARYAAGAATEGEQALARSIHGAAAASVLDAEGRRFSADVELAFALGAAADQPLEVVGKLDLDGALTEKQAFAGVSASPALKRLKAEARVAQAAARQSDAEGGPVLSLSSKRQSTSVPLEWRSPNISARNSTSDVRSTSWCMNGSMPGSPAMHWHATRFGRPKLPCAKRSLSIPQGNLASRSSTPPGSTCSTPRSVG